MTPQEAQIIIGNIPIKPEVLDDCYDITEYQEAKAMAIKALEQQPKTGHWEYVQYDYNPDIGNWHCSECRNIVIECANKNEKGGIPIYNFCPNCGAKMVESEDKE